MSTLAPPPSRDAVLEIRDLVKTFRRSSGLFGKKKAIHAVRGVSLDVRRGETLGIVGESGSGKSTMARIATRLHKPTEGSIFFNGRDLTSLRGSTLIEARRGMQMVFQDPLGCLDPRKPVISLVEEPLLVTGASKAERRRRVAEVLGAVGLDPAFYQRRAHELSGGQRQRVAIARAIALVPDLVVCDEPTSALDVTSQAHVLNLLLDMQSQNDLSMIFISHNLDVVRHMADRVAVMYRGQIVELAPADDLYERTTHPYTRCLISAIPIADPEAERARVPLSMKELAAEHPPLGSCPFDDRDCTPEEPYLHEVWPDHWVRCFPGLAHAAQQRPHRATPVSG